MLDLESPAPLRGGRVGEKRLRKRRELDALKDVGSGRRRKNGGATQELLGTSSDCSTGEVRDQEHVGVSVWRGVHGHRVLTAWWWLKWGLGASSIFLLAIITIWLHISTRFELDVVRRHIVRGEWSERKPMWCDQGEQYCGIAPHDDLTRVNSFYFQWMTMLSRCRRPWS